MTEWLMVASCSAAAAAVVYIWQRHAAAGERAGMDKRLEESEQARIAAEQGKSNAEVALRAKCDEMERLRADDVEDLKRQADQFSGEIQRLNAKLEAAERKTQEVRDAKAQAESLLAAATEAQRAGERMQAEREAQYRKTLDQGAARFRELAQTILEDRENKLKEDGTNPLSALVAQLKQEIENLKTSIANSDEKSATSHTSLMGKITTLVDQTNKVTEQANNLANAIRGDAQLTGEWGEMQLKRVLESSGVNMPDGYSYQETFVDDQSGHKSKRTDFVIKMPGERALVIDSKVTVAAVERYHAAETSEAREEAESEVLASVRGHVDEIVRADYQSSVPNAFPTVLMYIPLEEVYMLAMKARISVGGSQELLREYAQRHNVVFVNSASVVPVVRLVEMLWKIERTERNRQETIRAAEELLQRANSFIEEFLAVESAFKEVFARYEAAKGRLVDAPGGQSIAKAVSRLVQLGVQPRTRGGKTYDLAAPIKQDGGE
ncbi:MAG: DNA recombination protein RmuC [Kiritimatiellae bacterium]|nr:DNA recombination protein RmuC [Kiritimatiellia bacterium]